MQKSKLKMVFVGGGTGGHVSPNLAIINELSKIARRKGVDLDILYVGRLKGIEKDIAIKSGLKYKGIFAGKLRRYFHWRNLTDLLWILLGLIQSIFIIAFFRPDFVFAKGGFVTVPFGIASWTLGRKLIIHESDSVLGLSNRVLLPFSQKVFLGFPSEVYKKIPAHKSLFTGNPVRSEIINVEINKEKFYKKYGLNPKKKIIFVYGGSQGSAAINKLINEIIKDIVPKYILIHSAGEREANYFKQGFFDLDDKDRKDYLVYSYVGQELGEFLANADLVISRAGANSIAEIICLKKPAILIPFPAASADHQRKNANFLQKNHIASILDERFVNGKKLFEEIEFLIENKRERSAMTRNMENIFPENSGKTIANEIIKIFPL